MFVNYKSLYFVFVGVCFFSRLPSTLCPCLEWTDADSQTNRRFCFAAFRRILSKSSSFDMPLMPKSSLVVIVIMRWFDSLVDKF